MSFFLDLNSKFPNCKHYYKITLNLFLIFCFNFSPIFYTLAKHARLLKAFKLARYVIEKLRSIKAPETIENNVDKLILQAKADPFDDDPELLPLCYRCSTTNPLLNPRGNKCLNCFHPFIYSFPSFGMLKFRQT